MGKVQRKAIRIRRTPIKRWTDNDVIQILEFLENQDVFEKPTAQIYYKQLIDNSNINVHWSLLRCKVRNMRRSLIKAEKCIEDYNSGILEDEYGGTVDINDKVNRICPYFERLKRLFREKHKVDINLESTVDGKQSDIATDRDFISLGFNINNQDPLNTARTIASDAMSSSSSNHQIPETTQPILNNKKSSPDLTKKIEKATSMAAINRLTKTQEEQIETRKMKIQFQKEKFLKELAFNEKKLKVKRYEIQEKIKLEQKSLELKRLEIENNEKLKRLEIEQNEKIAKYEIEMKYKFQLELEKLKNTLT